MEWIDVIVLEEDDAEFSYPSLSLWNETVHVTYTVRREQIGHVEIALEELENRA